MNEANTVDTMGSLLERLENSPWDAIADAGRKARQGFGGRVDPCSIINAKSGNCSEDCAFCAQSVHHNTDAETYPLRDRKTIVDTARNAYGCGVRRFCIVTSGRGIYSEAELDTIAGCIREIKAIGIQPCATLGTLSREQLTFLKDAGLHRYHHNVETSKNFFPNICSTHSFEERVETLSAAREAGLSLCSGGIIGLGETMRDRAEMALALGEMDVDSVPLNFLMPIPGTPFEGAGFISPLEALKTIALFRHILPDKEIRICGGRAGALRDLHPMIFLAGANGLLMGDYLTTKGRDFESDRRMLADLGLKLPDE